MFSLSLFFWKFLNTIIVGHRITNVKRKKSLKTCKASFLCYTNLIVRFLQTTSDGVVRG